MFFPESILEQVALNGRKGTEGKVNNRVIIQAKSQLTEAILEELQKKKEDRVCTACKGKGEMMTTTGCGFEDSKQICWKCSGQGTIKLDKDELKYNACIDLITKKIGE